MICVLLLLLFENLQRIEMLLTVKSTTLQSHPHYTHLQHHKRNLRHGNGVAFPGKNSFIEISLYFVTRKLHKILNYFASSREF